MRKMPYSNSRFLVGVPRNIALKTKKKNLPEVTLALMSEVGKWTLEAVQGPKPSVDFAED